MTVLTDLILMIQQNEQTKKDKEILFKNCAPFTECTIKINNTQIDYAKYLDVAMPMYNLVENSDNCSKTSGSL